MGDLLVNMARKNYTHDELYRLLAKINDHLFQRDWLLDNAEELNVVIRHSIYQPPLYHYAVSTLINVIPVMFTHSRFRTWWERLLDSLVHAQQIGDRDLMAKLIIAISRYHGMVGSTSAAQIAAKQAHEYSQDSDAEIQLEAYAALIETYILRPSGDFNSEMFEEALAISRQSGSDEIQAILLQIVAVAYLHGQDYEKSESYAQEALELAEKMRSPTLIFRSALINACVRRHMSDWNTVKASLERAHQLYEMTHQTQRNRLLLAYEEATMYHSTGNLEKAAKIHLEALNNLSGSADAYEVGLCRTGLTLVYISMGCYDHARQSVQLTKPIWNKIDNKYMIAHTLYSEGYIAFGSGEHVYARNLLEQALKAAADIPNEKARENLATMIRQTIDEIPPENPSAM